jgi:hypothetical protein
MVADSIHALAAANYAEVGHFPGIAFDIDANKYNDADNRGVLRIFTIRDEQLIGYATFIVARGLHTKRCLRANHDAIYIDPRRRDVLLFTNFIEFCDAYLKKEGVELVSQSVHVSRNFGPLLKCLGYELVAHTWARRLNG